MNINWKLHFWRHRWFFCMSSAAPMSPIHFEPRISDGGKNGKVFRNKSACKEKAEMRKAFSISTRYFVFQLIFSNWNRNKQLHSICGSFTGMRRACACVCAVDTDVKLACKLLQSPKSKCKWNVTIHELLAAGSHQLRRKSIFFVLCAVLVLVLFLSVRMCFLFWACIVGLIVTRPENPFRQKRSGRRGERAHIVFIVSLRLYLIILLRCRGAVICFCFYFCIFVFHRMLNILQQNANSGCQCAMCIVCVLLRTFWFLLLS